MRRTPRTGPFQAVLAAALLASVLIGCASDGDQPAPTVEPTGALDDPATVEQLQSTVDEVVDELGVPGAVVLVTRGDQRWETVVGSADPDGDEPLEAGLSWPLRSITKSFTVTLVLQLADEGLLALDDPIDRWVDGVPGGDQVTIAQLADMSSGLGDYTSDAFIEDFVEDPTRWFTLDELIAYGLAEPVQAEPGAQRVYTNLNTLLLGRVVEAATGQPFDDALAERILTPLGLDETSYPTGPDEVTDPLTGYSPGPDGDLEADPINFSVFGPAGAMVATTDDLARWGPALATGEVIGDDAQAARLEAAPLDEGPTYDAYGLGIGELDGWWGHTGEGFGFTSLVMHDDETDTTVAIVANASQLESHAPTTLFQQLAPLLVG